MNYINPIETPDEQKYLTREEVASICRIKSFSTLWTWRKQGILVPSSKAGRKPLYLRSEVINFLDVKRGGSDA